MKAEGNEAKFGIEVFGVGGFEHLQAALHGEAGGDYENIFGVALILNKVTYPQDKRYSKNIFVVPPRLTAKNRFQVLGPTKPKNLSAQLSLTPLRPPDAR